MEICMFKSRKWKSNECIHFLCFTGTFKFWQNYAFLLLLLRPYLHALEFRRATEHLLMHNFYILNKTSEFDVSLLNKMILVRNSVNDILGSRCFQIDH